MKIRKLAVVHLLLSDTKPTVKYALLLYTAVTTTMHRNSLRKDMSFDSMFHRVSIHHGGEVTMEGSVKRGGSILQRMFKSWQT